MAYVIGILSLEEQAELEHRGWQVENAPPVDFDHPNEVHFIAPTEQLKMVWVDSSMFEVMNGPDWHLNSTKEKADEDTGNYPGGHGRCIAGWISKLFR